MTAAARQDPECMNAGLAPTQPSPACGEGLGRGNQDSGFAALLPPGMTAIADIIEQTRACAHQRIERDRVLADLLARAVSLHPAGFAVLDTTVLGGLET